MSSVIELTESALARAKSSGGIGEEAINGATAFLPDMNSAEGAVWCLRRRRMYMSTSPMRARRITPPITPPTIAPKLVLFRERDEEPLTGNVAEVAAAGVPTADAEGVLPADAEEVLDAEGCIERKGAVEEVVLPVLSTVDGEEVDGEVVASAAEVSVLEEDPVVVELTDEESAVSEVVEAGGTDEVSAISEVSEAVESEAGEVIVEVAVVVVCELLNFVRLREPIIVLYIHR